MKLSFIYDALGKKISGEDQEIGSIVSDSRQIKPGDVFVAIAGEQFDGHNYVSEVIAKKAALAIIEKPLADVGNTILVENSIKALGVLAKAWRQEINPYVIGITGSNGKTTVKELIASVLCAKYSPEQVLYTQGNLNNHLGVPLTLLNLTSKHQYAVIEMGMNHVGELAYLTDIVKPNVALVNNVLRAHIGCGFNGVEDIARAKAEIFSGVSENGLAILPKENSQYSLLTSYCSALKQRTFGISQGDYSATEIHQNPLSSNFIAHTPQGEIAVSLPLPGLHNICNALAVFASLSEISELSLTDIAKGLANYQSKPGRLHWSTLPNHSLLIDDTYNANPDSMNASIDILSQLPNQKLLVIGDMAELGEEAAKMHEEVGLYARQVGIDYLLALGSLSKNAIHGFGVNGLYFRNRTELLEKVVELINQQISSILVKGSHSMKMGEICQYLLEKQWK